MLQSDFNGSLLIILWPLLFYVPMVIRAFKRRINFKTYLFISIIQAVITTLILIPKPSGNGIDMIGYAGVAIAIFFIQIFFIGITLLISFISFLYRLYGKKKAD
jgi:hypothetical protein